VHPHHFALASPLLRALLEIRILPSVFTLSKGFAERSTRQNVFQQRDFAEHFIRALGKILKTFCRVFPAALGKFLACYSTCR